MSLTILWFLKETVSWLHGLGGAHLSVKPFFITIKFLLMRIGSFYGDVCGKNFTLPKRLACEIQYYNWYGDSDYYGDSIDSETFSKFTDHPDNPMKTFYMLGKAFLEAKGIQDADNCPFPT